MGDFKWWYLFVNPTCIAFLVVTIGVIYCLWKGYGVSKKGYEFQGLGNSGFDLQDVFESSPKKRHKRKNKHEERCREIFESIFDKPFKTVRPDWLKNPATGKNLELDGFCPDIKTHLGKGLAFEYDGAQHSSYNRHFHGTNPNHFVYQVKKDSWKDLRCKEKGVLLIRIPHFVAYQDLERYITQKLRKNGLGSSKSGDFLAGLYD